MIPRAMDPSDEFQQPWMSAWSPIWMPAWASPPPITSGPGRYSSASNVWHIGMVCDIFKLPCFENTRKLTSYGLDNESLHDFDGPRPATLRRKDEIPGATKCTSA